jgi:hypothetical protein
MDRGYGDEMMSNTEIRLYELVLENGRSSSPFVWRIRYALAHKGLAFELVPLGFLDIPKTFRGSCLTVPGVREALAPLRAQLKSRPFLGGDSRMKPLFD